MKKIIYIENEIKHEHRTQTLLKKFNHSQVIYIDKYTEVFNKKNQNFLLQKKNPSIILAKKHSNFLQRIPNKYTIGGNFNYYFSYMYNCIFDCKYCFLQGLYNSANLVVFINYEDFFLEMLKLQKKLKKKITIFSGYDCDSLAYNSQTGFIEEALRFFSKNKNLELEIRTKSSYVKPLLKGSLDNIIVAYSFTPSKFSKIYEKGVPSVEKRVRCIKKLIDLDWKIGLRFDPIIIYEGWEEDYIYLFKTLFKLIPNKLIHSVTYGNIRYPKAQFNKIQKYNVEEKLFFNLKKNKLLYEDYRKEKISTFCQGELFKYVSQDKIFQNF